MTSKLFTKLKNKPYRDLFVSGQIKTGLPFQIRAMRDQRGWTQEEVGKRADLPQSAIARLENPDKSHSPTIRTLLKLASAFDVALICRFAPFEELADWVEGHSRVVKGLSPEVLAIKGFEESAFSNPQTALVSSNPSPTEPAFVSVGTSSAQGFADAQPICNWTSSTMEPRTN